MYHFYIDKILCPVAPSKLQLKIKNQNKTATLINEGEINVLKQPGLTEVSFDLLLPNVKYPFAIYKSGFENAKFYLDALEKLKVNKKPFQFIVTRTFPSGKVLFDTNMKVSLEDYDIKEDNKQGLDVMVSVKLKQYRDYGTKICDISYVESKTTVSSQENVPSQGTVPTQETVPSEIVVSPQETRAAESSPEPTSNQSYTVKKGDCLWNIAKKFYGKGSKYTKIYEANKDKIKNPNLIYTGQVLTIPPA